MLTKKKISVFLCVFLILSFLTSSCNVAFSVPKIALDHIKTETFNINVVFIGFESQNVLEDEIEYILPSTNNPFSFAAVTFPHSEYDLNYTFSFLSEEKTADLESFMLSIAENETNIGYRANVTLVEELISGSYPLYDDFFIPYSGLKIDAIQVEDYINQNIYAEDILKPGYTFYLMNFTQFDSTDHSYEHTFTVNGVDFDSNRTLFVDYTGFDEKDYLQVGGWGGKNRFCFIDTSASMDLLNLLPVLFGFYEQYDDYYYYKYDIDAFIETIDISLQSGKLSLARYLSEWVFSYLNNLFFPKAHQTPLICDSYSVPIVIFNNLTSSEYDSVDFSWFISESRIESVFVEAFPWIDWQIDVTTINLNQNPELYNNIQNNIEENYYGNIVDIDNGLYDLLESQLETNFDLDATDEIQPYYLFLLDDTSLASNGFTVTELRFENFILLSRNQFDLFESGNVNEPLYGASRTIVVRIGQQLGLYGHYNAYYGLGSIYIDEVLNEIAYYYCGVSTFSTFYSDSIARVYFDYYYITTRNEYDDVLGDYEVVGPLIGSNKYIKNVPIFLEESYVLYHSMDYELALEKVKEAYNLLLEFQEIVENPSAFLTPGLFYPLVIGGSLIVIAIPITIMTVKGSFRLRKLKT